MSRSYTSSPTKRLYGTQPDGFITFTMKITFTNRIAQHFGKHYIEGHTMQNVITVKTKFSPLAGFNPQG
jgi:hypothetical protein